MGVRFRFHFLLCLFTANSLMGIFHNWPWVCKTFSSLREVVLGAREKWSRLREHRVFFVHLSLRHPQTYTGLADWLSEDGWNSCSRSLPLTPLLLPLPPADQHWLVRRLYSQVREQRQTAAKRACTTSVWSLLFLLLLRSVLAACLTAC